MLTLHGRPLLFATGAKLANPKLNVVVNGGGDVSRRTFEDGLAPLRVARWSCWIERRRTTRLTRAPSRFIPPAGR